MGPSPFIAWPIVPILVWLGIVALVIWAIWRGVRGPRGLLREPVCAKCHYPVRGLSALTCPECGSDLREAGIASPAMGFGRAGLVLAIIAWTVGVPIIALPPAVALAESLHRTSFSATHGYLPTSGAFRRVDLILRGPGSWNDGPPARTVEVCFTGSNGDTSTVKVNPHKAGPHPDEPTAPDKADRFGFARALGGLGVPTTDPAVQSEVRTLEGLVDSAAENVRASSLLSPGPLIQSGVSTVTSTTPPPWFGGAVLITGVLVWMIGLVLIVRARRRRMIALGIAPPRRRRAAPAALPDTGAALANDTLRPG